MAKNRRIPAPGQLINRELSWLAFNERVLALADDDVRPLLDRVRFAGIFANNLDEFYQVRVGGLVVSEESDPSAKSPDGLTPGEQLASIYERVLALHLRSQDLFSSRLEPALRAADIILTSWQDLDQEDHKSLGDLFEEQIFPLLTPTAVDPSHPFPYLSSLSLNLGLYITYPETGATMFARVKVPGSLPRFIQVPDSSRYVLVEDLIAAHLSRLFPGGQFSETYVFRVTRNTDIPFAEERASDLMQAIRDGLVQRRRDADVVRIEISDTASTELLDMLISQLDADRAQIFLCAGPVGMAGLLDLTSIDRSDLKVPTFHPTIPPDLVAPGRSVSVMEVISDHDLLVHHPYESFRRSVEAFIEEAANDQRVRAIKQTLYRSSEDDRGIVRALVRAAESGKQVVALVELKARFDEAANIERARQLERAGVHVVYGVAGLKTHTKLCLVIREEHGVLRRYAHLGTGNYNSTTARTYEDLGLFTANEEITADVAELFNYLTGYGRPTQYRELLVAPHTLRSSLLSLIRREQDMPDGRIIIKTNALIDPEVIQALYDASRAGTQIDCIVRGACALRPGMRKYSENIRVRSIVGRFLEHSRVFRFGQPDRECDYYIGSADLMSRNLDRRVETLVPILDSNLRRRIDLVLESYLLDDTLSWQLHGRSKSWTRLGSEKGYDVHQQLAYDAQTRTQDVTYAHVPALAQGDVETDAEVRAAGGIVTATDEQGTIHALLIYRQSYDDWTLPKGRLDAGETAVQAAQREVTEETGLDVRVGERAGSVRYRDRKGRRKIVEYWMMSAVPELVDLGAVADSFIPNEEVDAVRFVPVSELHHTLSYEFDRRLVARLDWARGC